MTVPLSTSTILDMLKSFGKIVNKRMISDLSLVIESFSFISSAIPWQFEHSVSWLSTGLSKAICNYLGKGTCDTADLPFTNLKCLI